MRRRGVGSPAGCRRRWQVDHTVYARNLTQRNRGNDQRKMRDGPLFPSAEWSESYPTVSVFRFAHSIGLLSRPRGISMRGQGAQLSVIAPMPYRGSFHDDLAFDEHVVPRTVDQVRGHAIGDTLEIADRDHLVDQKDWLIVGVDVVDRRIFVLEQMNEACLIQLHLFLARDHAEDLEKILLVRPVDLDLEEDPAQRGLVKDLVGVKVRGEDHQRVKGDLEFLARLQRQDVLVFLQRNDPAVDQLLRRFGLSAKIVDDEDAAR